MNVQFVSKGNPTGKPLFEAQMQQVPKVGEYVAVPGYQPTVVSSVHWVWGTDGKLGVAVVLG